MQKPLHKSWISGRLPERDDADSNGRVYVADSPEYPDYSFTISQWDKVTLSEGTPTVWKRHSTLKGEGA